MELKQPEKKYKSNHTRIYSCLYQGVFCLKYRRKVSINGIDVCLKEQILEK